MAYEVLARKWRPQNFQDVIGQEHITQTLVNAINTDRLAHAYLFSGARGVGKTTVARILAKAINCEDRQNGDPCNKCNSCVEITAGSSVDVQEIDGASNRGIDEIRELRENIKYMPSSGRFRVYIIDEVHMLTLQAFNALLKTLEEPPPHVKFLFATTEPHKVPVTILSRCQRFDFKRIPVNRIVDYLDRMVAEEGIKINRSGLTIIAREADGGMRDAQSLLDQVASFAGEKIEDRNITDILGIIDCDIIFEASGAIITGSAESCIDIVDRIYNFGYDIKEFYKVLMDQFRNLMVWKVTSKTDLLDMTEDDVAELKKQADAAGLEKLQQTLNFLIAREEDLRYTSHPRLVLETIMIKLCNLGELLSFGEIIKKIESLENMLSSSPSSSDHFEPGTVSEPEPVWEEEKTPEPDAAEKKDKGKDWSGLLDYVASRNTAMANVLKEWQLKSINGNILELTRGESSFSSSYLDDPERLDKFLSYCRDFFEKDMKANIIGDPATVRKNRNTPNTRQESKKTPQAKIDYPEPVQEVLKIFQGEVVEEKE